MIRLAQPVIGEEEKSNVLKVLESGMIAQGPRVKELEEKFAALCGTKFAVAVNSGTAAIHAALFAVGIGPGDEVIAPPFTFIASVNPVIMQGAKVVFADINPDTFNIDPASVKQRITSNTKAILAVDLYGQPADYDALRSIADEHNLVVIEDACQSVLAEENKKRAGNLGDIGTFSFYATKNLMSGEGGMITTNNEDYAKKCRQFRHHGQEETRYTYLGLGYNYRMSDLHAAIALGQLEKIEAFTKKRIENAARLSEGLSQAPVTVPFVKPNCRHVFHQYTIKVDSSKRDALMEFLKEKGVDSKVFYPTPLYKFPHLKSNGEFPVTEMITKSVLSLPVHPQVTDEEIDYIIKCVKEALA